MFMSGFCSGSIFFVRLTRTLTQNPNRISKIPNSQFSKPFSSWSSSSTPARFSLSPSSSIILQKGEITRWSVDGVSDAIVNASNQDMLGGGKVHRAIHRAAGLELQAACYGVPEVRPGIRCPISEARITRAFQLPVSHVIHTAAPIAELEYDPEILLQNSYRSCLKLAKENNIRHIAFPAMCCGDAGLLADAAARVAISTIKEFVNDFKEVHFVIFDDIIYPCWLDKAKKLLLVDDVSLDFPSMGGHEDVEIQSSNAIVSVSKTRCKEDTRDSSNNAIADAAQRFAEAIERSDMGKISDMVKIQQELEWLDLDRRIFKEAITYLGRNPTEANMFFGLKDEYKKTWIMMVLNRL